MSEQELAKALEIPRAIQLLAEWIAIDKGETRKQTEKYIEDARELHDYLTVIGYCLVSERKVE